jgi:hypothetical protein
MSRYLKNCVLRAHRHTHTQNVGNHIRIRTRKIDMQFNERKSLRDFQKGRENFNLLPRPSALIRLLRNLFYLGMKKSDQNPSALKNSTCQFYIFPPDPKKMATARALRAIPAFLVIIPAIHIFRGTLVFIQFIAFL